MTAPDDADDPLAGLTLPPVDPLDGLTVPAPPTIEPRKRPGSFKELAERKALERAYRDKVYPPQPPPLALVRSAASHKQPKKHEPPPVAELADLVSMYRRRRDEIAIDLGANGTGEESELQALSVSLRPRPPRRAQLPSDSARRAARG